jgi:hypothetical protein
MLFRKFASQFEEFKYKVKVQNASIIILSLSLAIVSFLAYTANRAKRTIIVPSTIKAQMEISDIDASPHYIRVIVSYALDLLYSYTPASAANRFEEFLISFVQGDKVRELRILLLERLRQIQSVKVSESIEIEEFIFEKRGALLIRAKLNRYTLGQPIATEPLYLRVLYRLVDGSLKISSLVNLTTGDFSRLIRAQQLEGKQIEEREKRRERRERQEERREESERLREAIEDNGRQMPPPDEIDERLTLDPDAEE